MKILWLEDTTLNIVVSCDDEVVDDYDVEVKVDKVDEVDIVNEDETHADLQFGDGSMAYGVFKNYYIDSKELWASLGDIPIDEDENIDEDWRNFPKGTNREEIWHWFENTFKVSVAEYFMGIKKDG